MSATVPSADTTAPAVPTADAGTRALPGDGVPVDGGDRRGSYRGTVARLAAAQKTTRGAPAYSRFVNRPAGRLLAAAAYLAGLSSNAVTMVSAAFSYSAIALLAAARPTVLTGITVCLLLLIGYAFDSADGQVARLGGTGSVRGEWLDHVVDAAKMAALHLAVLISMYRWFDLRHQAVLLVPMLFGLSATVWFFALILTEKLRPARAPAERGHSVARAVLVLPTDYGVFCLVFLIIGFHRVFLIAYCLLFAAHLLLTLASLAKWYREMPGPARRAAAA